MCVSPSFTVPAGGGKEREGEVGGLGSKKEGRDENKKEEEEEAKTEKEEEEKERMK